MLSTTRAAALTAFVLCAVICAQTPTGNIEGAITDPDDALVAGASVAVIETATGRTIELKTDGVGRYAARNLLPGRYEVFVQATGFASKRVLGIPVDAGAVVNIGVGLELASAAGAVTVTADPVGVDTTRQTLDSVVTNHEIENMPLFGRNFLDLAALAPGIQVRNGTQLDPTKGEVYRGVSVAGRSGKTTRVQIDGIDVTDEVGGTTTANFSPDSVSEFQLTRSSLDPSTSMTSAGAVNIISRSGGNQVHGGSFWDYYNQDMGARMQYNPVSVPFHRNRAGAAVGGPLVPNKLFWFADWERHYQEEQRISRVPDFPQLNLTQGVPIGIRYADGRLDWNATRAVRVFYRFHHDWNMATSGAPASPSQLVNWTNTSTVGVDFASARTTHTYRFGYVNFNDHVQSRELDSKFPRAPGGTPYHLAVGSYDAGPDLATPQTTYQDNFQNSYEGSLVVNRHTLRFGFDARRIVLGFNGSGQMSVTGSRNAQIISQIAARGANVQDPSEYPLLNFMVFPQDGYVWLAPAHGMPHGGEYDTRLAWFAQDSIKVARRLTLNLGVRWQYDTRFISNPEVPRDPVLERWIPGASATPRCPKNLFSPSFGFAWDPQGNGKTVIRGGFYRAFENSLIFKDESLMLPAGIGSDAYSITAVQGPDGKPIDVDGRHPTGNYSDLQNQPIKSVIGAIEGLRNAVAAAHRNYRFDPKSGTSLFSQTLGLASGVIVPGNQYKAPYALQFNIGVQRQLLPGMVLSADYVVNRAVGLPIVSVDYERRLDAATFNAASAQARMNATLGGRTVDQWIAANPSGNISTFRMINDATFTGLTPDYYRAMFAAGAFARYRALQVALRGRKAAVGRFKDLAVSASYALSRAESSGAIAELKPQGASENTSTVADNRRWNSRELFGPSGLDRTHILSAAVTFTVPGGFRLSSLWGFQTAQPLLMTVPNRSAGTSGANNFFATDLNGDGGTGASARPDLFPGLRAAGRDPKSFQAMNQVIADFNRKYAGQLTPHGQALVAAGLFTEAQLKTLGAVIPFVPAIPEDNPVPGNNLFVTDLRVDRAFKLPRLREGLMIVPFADFYNLFNHAPTQIATYGMVNTLAGIFGSLNFDYANAPAGQRASDLEAARGRLNPTRKVMVGIRFAF